MKEIRISFSAAIIIFLSVVVLTLGAFIYRSYDLVAMKEKDTKTQELLLQLRVDSQIARPFVALGWKMNIVQPPLPQQTQELPK